MSQIGRFHKLRILNKFKGVNLLDMSLDVFTMCLNRSLYRKHSEFFTQGFFSKIRRNNHIDEVHGVLSPYYFVIYNNDLDLLTQLLRKHGYQIVYKHEEGNSGNRRLHDSSRILFPPEADSVDSRLLQVL